MEFSYNRKLNLDIMNNSQKIMPIPIKKNPSPNVEKPNYYGKSPYPMAYQVSSRKNDMLQYDNVLNPSPRNQLSNLSDNMMTKIEPFSKDSCYLTDNKKQGVIGLMCNQAGNSNNSNFVRGNEFGLYNDWDLINNIKKLEYTVEQPVQYITPVQPNLICKKNSIVSNKKYNLQLHNIENYINYDKNKNMLNLIIILMTIIVAIIIIYSIRR